MNLNLNDFEICHKIPESFKIQIKSFHVFEDLKQKKNIIFITKEDKAFGFGNNSFGRLGFGHNREVEECTQINELSNQNIKDLYFGDDFVLAQNEKNELLSWGRNNLGQLGLGIENEMDEFSKPTKIDFFETSKFESICCGFNHTLVLLSNGMVYGWGSNIVGQLGSVDKDIINKPSKDVICNYLKITDKFKFSDISKFKYIYCLNFSSFAITTNGLLFSWGNNENGILGQGVDDRRCIPRIIDLFNVHEICSNGLNTYFLTNEGSVYFCGRYNQDGEDIVGNIPKQMENLKVPISNIFKRTAYYYDDTNVYPGELFCSDQDRIFYEFKCNSLIPLNIEYESKTELLSKGFGITPQTVHISSDGPIIDSNIYKSFEFMSIIGSGGFGTVGKYCKDLDKQFYAIKMIDISNSKNYSNEKYLREVQNMAKIRTHFVVQYYNSWIENNSLFIQMEFCFESLRNILSIKPKVFERLKKQAMNSTEYFISCEIFRQITEALNYLHSLPEPLIHRDLKPDNILIGMSDNKRICKLADFGLSKFTEDHSDYHTMVCATHKYRAPEIASGHRYDYKVDVWSLGQIGLEIFNLNIQILKDKSSSPFTDSHVKKLGKCDRLIRIKLLTAQSQYRISCAELLQKINGLKISLKQIEINFYEKRFEAMNLLYFLDIISS